MKNKNIFLFLSLSAILLSLPFYQHFSGIILFIALVPLLFVEDYLTRHKDQYKSGKVFFLAWVTFIIWNILTIYWIKNATIPGAVAAVIINSFVMAVAFWLIHLTHRTLGDRFGYFGFLVIWVAYEHFYLNTEINFPWLNIGNGFAKDIKLIQWYEYTGTLGGTIWVLFINLLIFILIRHYVRYRSIKDKLFELVTLGLVMFIPMLVSLRRFYHYQEQGKPYQVVIVQPNIDPYNEKFGGLSNAEQLSIILHLADSLTTDSTDYVAVPETAIDDNIWENNMRQNRSILRIKAFIRKHPRVKFITGAVTYFAYPPGLPATPTARKFPDADAYYDDFNAALQIDSTDCIQSYHKSKLVVGVETMPYPRLFHFLGSTIIDLGGTTGSYGTQKKRTPLVSHSDSAKVGIAICYESVFGEYVTRYVRNGSNMLFIITNDGWWGDTPGYKQHMNYARLRAIENRRSIARSANTGISCFINQRGEASQVTGWWIPAVIRGSIMANNRMTFYTLHGDYIGRICDFFAVMVLLYVLVQWLMKKKVKR